VFGYSPIEEGVLFRVEGREHTREALLRIIEKDPAK